MKEKILSSLTVTINHYCASIVHDVFLALADAEDVACAPCCSEACLTDSESEAPMIWDTLLEAVRRYRSGVLL